VTDGTTHSILAPSKSETWSMCVGAPNLAKGLPEVDAEYNASGSCSHWILEQVLKTGSPAKAWLGQELKFGSFAFVVDKERAERVQAAADAINGEPGQMWSERRLDTSPIFGVPNQEGHADVIKLDPYGAVEIDGVPHVGVLTVHDFKDGYIQVNAKNNKQGLCYLAAALYEFDIVAPIAALRFCIHQPKIHHYDEWAYTRREIEIFSTIIRPVAKLAYDIYHGIVEFDPAKHLNAGEEQCFWCPVRGRCPARAKRIVDMFAPLIQKHELDDKSLSQIYARLDEIEQACKDFRAEALRRALQGHEIDAYQLERGRRGNRHWTDKKKAESALLMVLPEEKVYEPREIIGPTEFGSLVDKTTYASVAQYIDQSDGQLTLKPRQANGKEVIIPKFGLVEEPKK
jgi:Protein of unknown function (DUF2800)